MDPQGYRFGKIHPHSKPLRSTYVSKDAYSHQSYHRYRHGDRICQTLYWRPIETVGCTDDWIEVRLTCYNALCRSRVGPLESEFRTGDEKRNEDRVRGRFSTAATMVVFPDIPRYRDGAWFCGGDSTDSLADMAPETTRKNIGKGSEI